MTIPHYIQTKYLKTESNTMNSFTLLIPFRNIEKICPNKPVGPS